MLPANARLKARLRLVATTEYAELLDSHDLEPTDVREVVREKGSTLVIGAFAALASYALFHLITVFPLSWIKLYTQQSTPGDYQVVVKPLPGSGDGEFARRISELISTDPKSWTAFSTAVAHAVGVRNRDLRMIIEAGPTSE